MQEKELNGIIRRSFEEQGDYAYKISDSGQYINGAVTHQKNPYDGFAFYKGKFVGWESKWLPKPQALDLQRLQDHQLEALKKTRDCLDCSYALFLVGIKWAARETRVYIFTDLDDIERRRTNRKNFLKKDFEKMDNYVLVKKGVVNIEELLKKGYKDLAFTEKEGVIDDI